MWANIQKRLETRPRQPYQTRHTYTCWCLTARFIAMQMGRKDAAMLIRVYAKGWMTSRLLSYSNRKNNQMKIEGSEYR